MVAVGFRFFPTDEELVNHYLKSKVLGFDSDIHIIPQVDICKSEPWELPCIFHCHFSHNSPYCLDCSDILSNDDRWYFFCPRGPRSTKAGTWRVSGHPRKVTSRDTNGLIGTKQTLVFYTGRAPYTKAQKTCWVIHEYHLADLLKNVTPPPKDFVLCLLMKQRDGNACDEVEASSFNVTNLNNIAVPPNNGRHTNDVAYEAQNQGEEEAVSRERELTPEEQALLLQFISEPEYQHQLGLQSQMYLDQEPSDMDFICMNDFSNDNEEMQFQFETLESDENAIEQYLVDRDEYTWAESNGHGNMAARRSEMPETHLIRVSSEYVNQSQSESSSETDTAVVHQSQVDPSVETSKSLNLKFVFAHGIAQGGFSDSGRHIKQSFGLLHEESGGSSVSSVQSPVDPIVEAIKRSSNRQGGNSQGHPSDSVRFIKQSFGFPQYESGGSSASSVHSIADTPVEIELTSPESPVNNTRTSRSQYQLKSHNLVAQGSARTRICLQDFMLKEPNQVKVRDSSSCNTGKHEDRPESIKAKASAIKLPQKEKSIVVSNKDSGMARDGSSKLNLNSMGKEGSGGNNQTGSIETPIASSHRSSQDVYFLNVLVGVILVVLFFVFVVLDMKDRISSVFN